MNKILTKLFNGLSILAVVGFFCLIFFIAYKLGVVLSRV